MKRLLVPVVAASMLAAFPASGSAHELALDHPAPGFSSGAPLGSGLNAGGEGLEWELLTSFPTGNPHTDVDFFTQGGEIYGAVGTLAVGPNAGGQTILKLTEDGEVSPSYVSSHASAACVSNPGSALGLQHDVEATPKGTALLNAENPFADTRDAQLLIDATDADGRCHDQGTLGLSGAPQGGLEIIDITDIANPVEIGLTSHVGEAHTVNIDPKRPHIAFAVTSDAIGVADNGDGTFTRQNEVPGGSDAMDLDGFEVVDLSSCMDFPAGTTLEDKRATCRPEVYRYRYESIDMVLGHSNLGNIYGCHELEIYPDDTLTCGSGSAMILLDLSNAFDDNGTPNDYSDDKPKGTPLPCAERASSSVGFFATGATVIDCVTGKDGADLTIPGWLAAGAPSLEGVEWKGSAIHMGRESATGAATPDFVSSEDIDFDHEAEFTTSKKFILATDERGGGVLPPGATCTQVGDNAVGNGGLHAYDVSKLTTTRPSSPEEAFEAYARTPDGEKAVFRAPINTGAEGTECTAHVFHQIPGQNRIFMAWYSQGTQVVDYVEHADGSFEFIHRGYFIPENANTWTSAIFDYEENADGSFTYYGMTGDFALGDNGRSAIDIYKVTIAADGTVAPAPEPEPAPQPATPEEQPGLPATGGGLAGFGALVMALAAGGTRLMGRRD